MTHRLHTARCSMNCFRKAFFFLLPVFCSLFATAQDKIETDRPTKSLTAKTAGKQVLQMETGVRRDQENATDYSFKRPVADRRYGLFERLELRLNIAAETRRLYTEGETTDGLLPVEIGAKAALWHTKDTSFLLTAYGQISLPHLAAEEHRPGKTFYRTRLLLDNRRGAVFGLQTNISRDWSENEGGQG